MRGGTKGSASQNQSEKISCLLDISVRTYKDPREQDISGQFPRAPRAASGFLEACNVGVFGSYTQFLKYRTIDKKCYEQNG